METKNIIRCHNCEREIELSKFDKKYFKCRDCYTTIATNKTIDLVRSKINKKRNKWVVFGAFFSILPMILIVFLGTNKPFILSGIYITISAIIIWSLYYFNKRQADLMVGILFSEIGIFFTFSKTIFSKYGRYELIENLEILSFQANLFLATGLMMIIIGLLNRRKFSLI